MASMGREGIFIGEIWLNIYLTEMLNSNIKVTAELILHMLDYF